MKKVRSLGSIKINEAVAVGVLTAEQNTAAREYLNKNSSQVETLMKAADAGSAKAPDKTILDKAHSWTGENWLWFVPLTPEYKETVKSLTTKFKDKGEPL